MQVEWVVILSQVFLAAGGLSIFCAGAFWRQRPPWLLFALAFIAVCGAGLAAVVQEPRTPEFLGMLDVGSYARFFTFLFSLVAALTLLFAYHYTRTRGLGGDEFYGLILFAALGMVLISSAVHWLIFFLGFELLSLSLYVLIAIRKGEPASNEAGVKYFIMGAVSSAFLTFGIAVLYAVTGTMTIARSLAPDALAGTMPGIVLGVSLIFVGIGFKVSLVPFHLWTPDVYQGAPAPVTAFLSSGSKVALFSALLRIALHAPHELWSSFLPIIWMLAALTMVVGNVTALEQSRVKRLLAYSSIAHMGYLLMALLAVKENGASAVMFALAVFAVMDLGAFGAVTALSEKQSDLDELDDCRSLGYSHPWRAALLAACLFSLAGLPPTGGFIAKFVIFQAVLQANFVVLAVIGIVTVIISIYFYLKVIVSLYMRPAQKGIAAQGPALSDRLACAVVLVLILWLGLIPSPLFDAIAHALSSFSRF